MQFFADFLEQIVSSKHLLRPQQTYAEKRANEYPSVGDMIDAFCKARAGDDSELIALMNLRQAIKEKYPKV